MQLYLSPSWATLRNPASKKGRERDQKKKKRKGKEVSREREEREEYSRVFPLAKETMHGRRKTTLLPCSVIPVVSPSSFLLSGMKTASTFFLRVQPTPSEASS